MNWTRRIAALILASLLTGCAGWGLTPEEAAKLTPQQRFFKLQGEIIAAFEPAVVYAKRPPCSTQRKVGCHNPDVVAALLQLKTEVDWALDEAKTIVFGDYTGDEKLDAVLVASAVAARVIARLNFELVRAGVYDSSKREWFYQEVLTYG